MQKLTWPDGSPIVGFEVGKTSTGEACFILEIEFKEPESSAEQAPHGLLEVLRIWLPDFLIEPQEITEDEVRKLMHCLLYACRLADEADGDSKFIGELTTAMGFACYHDSKLLIEAMEKQEPSDRLEWVFSSILDAIA